MTYAPLRGFAAIGCTALFAACASTSGPPCSYDFRDQNILDVAGSVATSEYQRCTEHLLNQLAELEVEVDAARRNADRLDRLAAESSAEERQAAERLARANRESEASLAELRTIRADTAAEQQRYDELIAQQRALEDRKRQASQAALDGDAAELQAEIDALERQQRALRAAIDAEAAS